MMMIGSGNENGVDFLAYLVKHDAVVRKDLRFALRVSALQPLLHNGMPLLVRINKCVDDLRVLPNGFQVRHPSAPAADLDALEFFTRAAGANELRESWRKGKCCCRHGSPL